MSPYTSPSPRLIPDYVESLIPYMLFCSWIVFGLSLISSEAGFVLRVTPATSAPMKPAIFESGTPIESGTFNRHIHLAYPPVTFTWHTHLAHSPGTFTWHVHWASSLDSGGARQLCLHTLPMQSSRKPSSGPAESRKKIGFLCLRGRPLIDNIQLHLSFGPSTKTCT